MRRPPTRRARRHDAVLRVGRCGWCWPSSSPAAAAGTASGRWLRRSSHSVSPAPDYLDVCAPVGADTSGTCLRITLDAIDAARATEGVRPMVLPSDFPRLTRPRAALRRDRPRAGRPGAGAVRRPDDRPRCRAPRGAPNGAAAGPARARLRLGQHRVDRGRRQRARCRLPVAVRRRSGQRRPGCSGDKTSGCWADRQHRPQPLRPRRPRHGSRLRPDRRHVRAGTAAGPRSRPRWPWTPSAGDVRLHLEAGPSGHGRRDAAAPAGDPRLGVRHRDSGPKSQRGARARLHAGLRRRRASTTPRLYRRRLAPSTTRTRSRGSVPWCCRRGSPS